MTGEFPAQMASNAEMSPYGDVIMERIWLFLVVWRLFIGNRHEGADRLVHIIGPNVTTKDLIGSHQHIKGVHLNY